MTSEDAEDSRIICLGFPNSLLTNVRAIPFGTPLKWRCMLKFTYNERLSLTMEIVPNDSTDLVETLSVAVA